MRPSRSTPRTRAPLPPGFGVIWTTVALDLIGFGILFPVLARYARDAGASPATAGLLVASFSIAQLVFSPITGRLSDRVGRKPVIIMSLVGTALGSLLTGLAGSLWLLFLARIIDGASGASVSVAQAAVTDVAAPEDRARLLGLLGAAFGAGFALGPAIGGVAALVSHRLPFFIAAAIAGVNALAAVKRLPETRPKSSSKERVRRDTPLSLRRSAGRLVLVTFVSLVAFSGFEATFSLLAEARFNLSESSTYGLFFLIGIGLVVVQGGAIHTVVVKLGELRTVRFGLACNAIGLCLVAVDAGWAPLTLALALLIVGQGLVAPTLSALVAGRASDDRRGEVLGIQQSAGGLARSVGPALGGYLFGQSIPAPYLVGAALVTVAMVLVTDR
ncbi:MAG: transporter, family, tetracycline resistance protein [Acidimicrobiaceae bacterium]|jgi:multidrug resistance protein